MSSAETGNDGGALASDETWNVWIVRTRCRIGFLYAVDTERNS